MAIRIRMPSGFFDDRTVLATVLLLDRLSDATLAATAADAVQFAASGPVPFQITARPADRFTPPAGGALPPEAVDRIEIAIPGEGTRMFIDGLDVTLRALIGMDRAQLLSMLTAGPTALQGSDAADRFSGRDGDDVLSGGNGADTLFGGAGDDRLDGGFGRNVLYGGEGQDTLDGYIQPDTLFGGPGNDLLRGLAGADTLRGGSGEDTLQGGIGADLLTGGAGADTFLWWNTRSTTVTDSRVGARDTVTDFRHGVDRLDLSYLGDDPLDFVGRTPLTGEGQVRIRHEAAHTIVDVSLDTDAAAELSFRLTGRLALTADDFIL
jgi:hypothetical protein